MFFFLNISVTWLFYFQFNLITLSHIGVGIDVLFQFVLYEVFMMLRISFDVELMLCSIKKKNYIQTNYNFRDPILELFFLVSLTLYSLFLLVRLLTDFDFLKILAINFT